MGQWNKQENLNSHTHANKTALDRLGINANTKLTIDGIEQSGGTTTNKLNGIKVAFLGDSVTDTNHGGGNIVHYDKIIADKTGIINFNYGVAATTVAKRDGRTDSMLERYVNMDSTADVVMVLGGTNDFGAAQKVPIGTFGDGLETTFYGAYEALVVGLLNKYPNKPIGLMTPIARGYNSGLEIYVKAIKDIAAKYSILPLDLYNESGLSTEIPYHVSNYYYMQDKLHPNTEGQKIIARPIKSFLERIVG